MDLSWPHPPKVSVNAGIDKTTFLDASIMLTFPTVDSLAYQVFILGPEAMMYKRDLSHAYRQIPPDPHDYSLVGFKWRGAYYFDTAFPMGLTSSAYISTSLFTRTTRILLPALYG